MSMHVCCIWRVQRVDEFFEGFVGQIVFCQSVFLRNERSRFDFVIGHYF